MNSLLIILLLSISTAVAESSMPDRVVVQSLQDGIKLKSLGPDVEKREKLPVKARGKSELPNPVWRDRLLNQAGLRQQVAKMDHLDRDLLYLKMKRYQLKRLVGEYPWLTAKQVMLFKKLISKGGKGEQ